MKGCNGCDGCIRSGVKVLAIASRLCISHASSAVSSASATCDVFAFVADQDKVVTVEFVIEAGLDVWMEQSEVSGIAKFVGAGLANTALAPESKMRTRSVVMTGMVIEAGIRNYYVIHANSLTENFSAAVQRVTAEAIDDYAGNRAAIQINAQIRVSDPLEVMVGE